MSSSEVASTHNPQQQQHNHQQQQQTQKHHFTQHARSHSHSHSEVSRGTSEHQQQQQQQQQHQQQNWHLHPPPRPHPQQLPPIHHLDARASPSTTSGSPSAQNHNSMQSQHPPPPQQQHPYSTTNGHNMSAPPPPYPPPPYQTYPNAAPVPMPATGQQPNGAMMRYALPPQPVMDARAMPGGRHKKEIKRRTKTGCLTCRKRRIKCDEAQPSCRNCAKSKRECLGYDPIYRAHTGPANIQPAPAGSNPPAPQANLSNPAVPHGLPANSYPPSHAFAGTGGSFIPAPAAPSTDGSHPYGEYPSGVDSVLSTTEQPMHMAQSNYPSALQPQRSVKPVKIEELFSLNDVAPQYQHRDAPPPLSEQTQHEIGSFFKYHYAAGLDRLFETSWYQHRGLEQLQKDPMLLDFVAQCAEQMKVKSGEDTRPRISLEARLVWMLAAMPRSAASAGNVIGSDPMTQELLPRIDTVEYLLTGQFLDPSRVPPPPQQPSASETQQDQTAANQKYNERGFWHHLGRFVSLRDDTPGALKSVNDALHDVRLILNMLENRDVLYSIAIARHIGGRMPEFHPHRHLAATTNDPADDINKLKVAHQFVEGEDQRGTTQVIQRVCSMALRSWILQKS